MTKQTGERTTSPPMMRAWYWRQMSIIPAYISLMSGTAVSGGSPSVTSATPGVPPIAAMSLMLDAIAFQPRSRQGVVAAVKWTPSTIVSVV